MSPVSKIPKPRHLQRFTLVIQIAIITATMWGQGLGTGAQSREPSFFPLAVGNNWQYKFYERGRPVTSRPYDISKEVIAKKTIGSLNFYLMITTRFDVDGSIRNRDSTYYRMQGDTLFRLRAGSPHDSLSISVDLCFSGYVGSESNTQSKAGKLSTTIRMKTDSTITFEESMRQFSDLGALSSYRKGIGLSDQRSYGFGLSLHLVKYHLVSEE